MLCRSLVTRGRLLACSFLLTACGSNAAAQPQTGERAGVPVAIPADTELAGVDTLSAMRLSAAFRGAAKQAMPAVVAVTVVTESRVVRRRSPGRFPFFFDDPEELRSMPQQGQGSGFIFDSRGYILTNRHVINDADEVTVTLRDGRQYAATVVGADPNTDVAVIKIEPDDGERLPTAEFGNSDYTQVGDWVLALGNPLDLDFTVTAGIVSAKGRSIGILRQQNETALEAFIQTDAAINPGNSGGPLVDLRGRVVGINTAIQSRTGFYAGYGFAIPINLAHRVAEDLIEYGAVRRPRLGVQITPVTEADAEVYGLDRIAGAEVVGVQAGMAADRAGIRLGDVIVALDGEAIDDATELTTRLARRQPGDRVELTLVRAGERRDVTVELGQFEAPERRDTAARSRPAVEELLGFRAVPLTEELASELEMEEAGGVIIRSVQPFSPAARAGVSRGLLLRRINGEEVESLRDVTRIAEDLEPGDVVSLVVSDPEGNETIINYRTRR